MAGYMASGAVSVAVATAAVSGQAKGPVLLNKGNGKGKGDVSADNSEGKSAGSGQAEGQGTKIDKRAVGKVRARRPTSEGKRAKIQDKLKEWAGYTHQQWIQDKLKEWAQEQGKAKGDGDEVRIRRSVQKVAWCPRMKEEMEMVLALAECGESDMDSDRDSDSDFSSIESDENSESESGFTDAEDSDEARSERSDHGVWTSGELEWMYWNGWTGCPRYWYMERTQKTW